MILTIREAVNGWIVEKTDASTELCEDYSFTSANKLVQFLMSEVYESEHRIKEVLTKKLSQAQLKDGKQDSVGTSSVSVEHNLSVDKPLSVNILRGHSTGDTGKSNRKVDQIPGGTPQTVGEDGKSVSKKQKSE